MPGGADHSSRDIEPPSTTDRDYTERLHRRSQAWWKRALGVQRPYRWNLRRLKPGRTLDIGCGIGRALAWVDGVGVDHNPASVEHCRRLGLTAYTPEEFRTSHRGDSFETILLSHVAEHMTHDEVVALLREYLVWLEPDGQLILITPQERGFASDGTHVEFMDFAAIARALEAVGFVPDRQMSFPFPRSFGKLFVYNEFVVTARRARDTASTPGEGSVDGP